MLKRTQRQPAGASAPRLSLKQQRSRAVNMLAAEKDNQVTALSVRILELQLKEFQYLYSNLQNLITVSAIFVGFVRCTPQLAHGVCRPRAC